MRRPGIVLLSLLMLAAARAATAPNTPVITEPLSDGQIVNPSDLHMEAPNFSDPDGDTHASSDVEIWKVSTNEKIWDAPAVTGVEKVHLHLGDGTFVGSYAGRLELEYGTDYRIRWRYRDSAGEVSAWAIRLCTTSPPGPPGVPGPIPWTAPTGFVVEVVAEGFEMPVNVAFVPNPGPNPTDPFFYVTELYGTIKVVLRDGTIGTYAGSSAVGVPAPSPTSLLNFNPTGSFPGSGEQGLAGLCVDPATGDVFASVLYASPAPDGPHYPKVLRLHSTDGGRTAASITTILDMPGETQGQSHFVSNLSIGPDGKLYVHNGDGFDYTTSQNLDSYRGKVLRMNLNGTPATDNPFYDASNGINSRDYVWAYGLRNPFGGTWRASDGSHYEVENGPSVDRFAKVVAGRNFGWNDTDASMANFAIHNWSPAHAPVNVAFIQSSTFTGSGFPFEKMDHAFVTESGPTYAGGPQALGKRIVEFVLDGAGNKVSGPTTLVEYNGTGRATAVGLACGPDGLYFTELYKDQNATSPIQAGARVMRVRWVGTTQPPATGTGLKGDYYTGVNFDTLDITRTDPTIDFNWPGRPAEEVPWDNFSVRWTGFVTALSSETYTFTTNSDDGIRLWVNGQQLVNNWINHGPTENSGQIILQAGQSYSIQIDYFDAGGLAVAQLFWSTPTIPKQIVPMAQLSPTAPTGSTVAAPTFSPPAGPFSNPMSVTISSATAGASIRYTTDGSTPTATVGTLYAGPVPISATTTLKAIAYKSGMTDSSVTTGTYTYAPAVVADPTFSPPAGPFSSPMSVTISTSTTDALIRYTTDGSTPTPSTGTPYTSPVPISATTTFKAIAYKSGMTNSAVVTAAYTFTPPVVAAPTFSPAPGNFSSPMSVTISSATAGASIRYTTDGSTPSSSTGTLYSGPVAISATTSFKAIATKSGMTDSSVTSATYTYVPPVVAAPTFSPTPGSFTGSISVTMSSATAGASIRYTTDGSTPTSSTGTLYGGPVPITTTTTFKAIAYKSGAVDSSVSAATYTLATAGGTGLRGDYYTGANFQTLTLTRTDPTVNFDWPGRPAETVPWDNFSVRWTGFVTAVSSETYTFWTNTDDGCRLWVNGVQLVNDWNNHGPTQNSGQIALLAGQQYSIQMDYYDAGGGATAQLSWSTPTIAKQIIPQAQLSPTATGPTPVAAPTFAPAPGSFSSPMSVTISSATTGASIRYTTDGSTPTSTVGTLYAGPVAISATTSFKAIATKSGMTDSTVTSATYTFVPPVVADPTYSPAPGPFSSPMSVTISTTTSGASIRYTTDGSTPSSSAGTLYGGPVAISATTTFKAIAFKSGSTDSAVVTATYTFSPAVVAAPTYSPAPGSFSSPMSVTISSATAGASIRYTTDGSTPTSTVGTLYAGPVSISATTTFKAIAFKSGMADSAVTTATYTFVPPVVAAPTFSPPPGSFSGSTSVTISSATSGASIRYTTDGTTPTSTTGLLYAGPVVINATTTFRAIAYKSGMTDSAVTLATYTLATAGSGTGLKGDYYTGTNFQTLTATRVDPTINFTWNGRPEETVPWDNFSVRWTGTVTALSTETYTFWTNTDDGARLWVNGVQLVNDWNNHGATQNSGTIALQSGQAYAIQMEFYDAGGSAIAQLSWSTPTIAKQIIPQAQLTPPAGTTIAKAAVTTDVSGVFQSLLDAAAPGDTVTLEAGSFVVSGSLFIPPGVTLRGAGPGRTILNGAGGPFVIRLTGGPAEGTSVIQSLTLTGGNIGLDAGAADVVLTHVVVARNKGAGITSGPGSLVSASHLTVADNGGDGLSLSGSALLRNAIVSGNGGLPLVAPGAVVTYSDLLGGVSFVDPAAMDYRASAGSATIDAGDPADPSDAEPMPNGGRANQGAYGNTADAEASPVVSKSAAGGGSGSSGGGCGLTGLEALAALGVLAAARRRRLEWLRARRGC